MPTSQAIESLQRRLLQSLLLFVAGAVIEFGLSLTASSEALLRKLALLALGYALLIGGYVYYAVTCVRTAKALDRSTGPMIAYFVCLPFVMIVVTILALLMSGLGVIGVMFFFANRLLEASPIALYISLRGGLNAAYHDAIFE